jgi:hypothetical protein
MKDFHLQPGPTCPKCGGNLDGALNTTGDGHPEKGDLSICVYCGELLQFTASLKLELLPEAALASLSIGESQRLERARRVVHQVIAERGGRR